MIKVACYLRRRTIKYKPSILESSLRYYLIQVTRFGPTVNKNKLASVAELSLIEISAANFGESGSQLKVHRQGNFQTSGT